MDHLLKHFSHEHVLERTRSSRPNNGYNSICFGCKIEILPGRCYCYKCKTCSFFLHQVCFDMPQQVQHPVDPKHKLILLSRPEKIIECKACQQNITSGLCYNCPICGNFYHTLCLAAPLSVKLPIHGHKLELEFSPPYDFQCDLCNRPSYHGWLYRCGLCEFDAHISCSLMERQAKLQMIPETGRIDIDRKDNELMELLSIGMKEKFQDNEAMIPTSEDDHTAAAATPSYQFSDACFSIDFAKSFLKDDHHHHQGRELAADFDQKFPIGGYVVFPKGLMSTNPTFDLSAETPLPPTLDLHSKSLKKAQEDIIISTGIGSHVWGEIVQENLRTSNAATAAKQTKKSNSVSIVSSFRFKN